MKCYYEVLEIAREATDNEIKSAYRKLALKWHPDKNLGNVELAKDQFQIVQQAYEVLSDQKERSWYDNHRDQILHGSKSTFEDKSLDLFQYFTTQCFKGYSDDPGGFYEVYGKVFDQIAKEDIEFMQEKEEFCAIPLFGRSDSDLENVRAFYDYWMSYSTKKCYSWLDPYDISEGKGDRRVLKAIEKENKKVRAKAKKERNEEVRNLVSFVRKRDKRVHNLRRELEAKNLENRRKHEEISRKKRLERKKMFENSTESELLNLSALNSELEQIEKNLLEEFGGDDDEDEEMLDNLYCVACNKLFKTSKAFENHESSKKHRINVEKLRETLLEDENFEEIENSSKNDDIPQISDEAEAEINEEEEEEEEEEEVVEEINKLTKKDKKKKKNKIKQPIRLRVSESSSIEDVDFLLKISSDDEEEKPFEINSKKNQKKKRNPKNLNPTKIILSEPIIIEKIIKKSSTKAEEEEEVSFDTTQQCCKTCKSTFSSKNKLFEHLKRTNHGVYLPTNNTKKAKTNNKI